MLKIILASGSPRRSELLKLLRLNFEVMPADIDEEAMVLMMPGNMQWKCPEKKRCG